MSSGKPVLSARNLTKTFASTGIRAVDRVSLTLFEGEILSLVGENGAGKTTLMKILSLQTPPDEGVLEPSGGLPTVGLLSQHALPGPGLLVWQYICLGQEETGLLRALREDKILLRLEKLAQEYHLALPWKKQTHTLTANQLQKAALLALILKNPQIFIFDEPTASLHDHEAQAVLTLMQTLAQKGKSVIFISHKMGEVRALSDRILVMRGGKISAQLTPGGFHLLEEELLKGLDPVHKAPYHPIPDSHLMVELRRAQIFPQVLGPLNLKVHTGEIYGLAGIRQDGMEALEEALAGIRPFSGGLYQILEENVAEMNPRLLRARGMAYVPAERRRVGSVDDATLVENLIPHRSRSLSWGPWLLKDRLKPYFAKIQKLYGFNGGPFQRLGSLSGGNLQKLLLAREMEESPRFLLLSEPTWGLDLQSREELFQTLEKCRASGAAILILSSDVQELLERCDTIGALYQGQVTKEMPAALWNASTLGRAVLGLYP